MDTYNVRSIPKKVVCFESMFLFLQKLQSSHGEQLTALWRELQHERHKPFVLVFWRSLNPKSE